MIELFFSESGNGSILQSLFHSNYEILLGRIIKTPWPGRAVSSSGSSMLQEVSVLLSSVFYRMQLKVSSQHSPAATIFLHFPLYNSFIQSAFQSTSLEVQGESLIISLPLHYKGQCSKC